MPHMERKKYKTRRVRRLKRNCALCEGKMYGRSSKRMYCDSCQVVMNKLYNRPVQKRWYLKFKAKKRAERLFNSLEKK